MPRCYKQDQSTVRSVEEEVDVRSPPPPWEPENWSNYFVVGQSPDGENVGMETEYLSPGNNWWRRQTEKTPYVLQWTVECELVIALLLFAVATYAKCSENTITNPNPVYNDS
jgi:hypothetical protein